MRRKKWSEEEEQTLITRYAELSRAGSLVRLKTREKRFEPIAAHVNAMHHFQDNVAFPWEWSWRDLSVKIQNMRHQYLGVKQKISRVSVSKENGERETEFEWAEGLIHWPNFLLYKDVFGDLELEPSEPDTGACSPSTTPTGKLDEDRSGRGRGAHFSSVSCRPRRSNAHGNSYHPGEGGGSSLRNMERDDPLTRGGDAMGQILDIQNGVYKERAVEQDFGGKKKLKPSQDVDLDDSRGGSVLAEGRILAFLSAYVTEQKERDAQREVMEREKDRERQEREMLRELAEREREQSRQERERVREEQERRRERERKEKEWEREVLNQERADEMKRRERAWEEKREKEKHEWRERMTAIQLGHQASMMQMLSQMMQGQQNVVALLLSVFLRGSSVEETPGQRSALALQLLHSLQQQHSIGGTFSSGEKKGGLDGCGNQFVIDGTGHIAGTH